MPKDRVARMDEGGRIVPVAVAAAILDVVAAEVADGAAVGVKVGCQSRAFGGRKHANAPLATFR